MAFRGHYNQEDKMTETISMEDSDETKEEPESTEEPKEE